MLRKGTMIIAVIAILLPLAIKVEPCVSTALPMQGDDPVRVVVSIEMLKTIVSPILRGIGETYSIVSGEAEPHSFTLTPEALRCAGEADLIVITGHMEWENRLIERIAESRGVSPDLISLNLLELDGIKIISTEEGRNLHGFWLLPDNALIIAREVKERVSKVRPDLSQKLIENYMRFEEEVLNLERFLRALSEKYNAYGRSVIIGFYEEMYIAEMLGLKVGSSLLGEEGTISPEKLRDIYDGLRSGKYECIIVSEVALFMENTKRILEELSRETGSPVAYVLTVSSNGLDDYNAVMYYNAGQVYCAISMRRPPIHSGSSIYPLATMILLAIVALETIILIKRWVKS